MAKRIILILLVAFLFNACKDFQKEYEKQQLSYYQKVYQRALKTGDILMQANALFHLTLLDVQQSSWKDTLFRVYYRLRNQQAIVGLGEELLQKNPNDTFVIALVSQSYENLGNYTKAYEMQKKLFALTKSPVAEYRLVTLEYNLQMLDTAYQRVEKLFQNKAIDSFQVEISTPNGMAQIVPLRAALHNARGIIRYARKDNRGAIRDFQQALRIMPYFQLAYSNYQQILSAQR